MDDKRDGSSGSHQASFRLAMLADGQLTRQTGSSNVSFVIPLSEFYMGLEAGLDPGLYFYSYLFVLSRTGFWAVVDGGWYSAFLLYS